MISINTSIFRDYDIRGVYPDDLNEETYYILGRAFAVYINAREIAVGHDTRISSPALFEAFTRGIMDQGTDVVNLGLISTEIHYFASGRYNFPANVIISASHNPPQYNGLKIVTQGVVPLHGSFGFPQIKELAIEQHFTDPDKRGIMKEQSVLSEWITHALSFVDVSKLRPIKVVVDAGNGMGGISWQEIIGKIPCNIIPLYFEPDGRFPHHLPDPLDPKNLTDLQEAIHREKADLGIALDGDADRMFVADETGRLLSGTITTAILARHLLQKHGPNQILFSATCGRIVPETITKHGGTPHRVRVGHSFIKQYMKETNALFAGEHSGHFYFRDNFRADSSFIAGLILLESLSMQMKPLSELLREYDKYPASGEINFSVPDTTETIQKIEQVFTDAKSTDQVDGLSVWYADWWFNMRASKTEPLLRLNVEADSDTLLQEKLKMLEDKIRELGGTEK